MSVRKEPLELVNLQSLLDAHDEWVLAGRPRKQSPSQPSPHGLRSLREALRGSRLGLRRTAPRVSETDDGKTAPSEELGTLPKTC